MIELSKIRLVNWYGFSSMTVPIGAFTLIAGKNGNGKSVLLDAIKYALYGDTVFNKSTENKGSRTIPSYTRGLLDATANSYMRPADKMPNVYTHIVLEMHEKELDKYFILGTVIETNSGNGIITQRYVIEEKHLNEIEHTYEKGTDVFVYSAGELQKKYGLKMFSATEGLATFMQRTGLRLNEGQLAAFRRKLRSIMSYDPNAKIDQFIRESVLEEKKVDFTKLVETKSNIDKLTEIIMTIDSEISELENILRLFEEVERKQNVILTDDIKIAYKRYRRDKKNIEKAENQMILASKQIEEDDRNLKIVEDKEKKTRSVLEEASYNLNQMDCAKAIREAENVLSETEKRKDILMTEKKKLLELENRISELMNWMHMEGKEPENREILSSLSLDSYSKVQKEKCVDDFISFVKDYRDLTIGTITRINDSIKENEKVQMKYQKIIDECNTKKTTFSEIPDYVALKDEINKEFKKRGILSEARFACEYVIGLTDEAWRDVIEGYLGRRRYTILVEPEYYDLADDILNASKNKFAHLFNTKLLMKKEVQPVEDSVTHFVKIKNTVAKKYFDYQLGRFHAVDISNVRDFENAMSKEGRVSVAMDSYFIRFDSIRYYYLGRETIELNKKRAEKKLIELKKENDDCQDRLMKGKNKKSYLDTKLPLLKHCNYDACREFNEILTEYSKKESELKALKDAQSNNMEYLQLSQHVSDLEQELEAIQREMNQIRDDKASQQTVYRISKNDYDGAKKNAQEAEKSLQKYELENYTIYVKAIDDYEQFLEAGKAGNGGILKDRERSERALRKATDDLKGAQYTYNAARTVENQIAVEEGSQAQYRSRKDRIWMDDRQEIQEKLKSQTQKYESIFKNEFVLTVLKSCEAARDDLKHINAELKMLDFKSVYSFDVNYIKDGSDYEKILEYAKYLKEREELGTTDGQMTFESMTMYSNDRGEELEKEIKRIISKIVSSNDKEQIERFADYRNYMNYEILVSNDDVLNKAKLSKQSGYNSGAEVQIPYMLILLSALLMIYNDKTNSTRLVFIDEPFAKMDPTNVRTMLKFMKSQKLQMIFCAPDKTELIGNECHVILPVLRTKPDLMEIGIVEIHEGVSV